MSLLLLFGVSDAKIKAWDGAAWQLKPVKTWDGAAWQPVPAAKIKTWDGAAWQPVP